MMAAITQYPQKIWQGEYHRVAGDTLGTPQPEGYMNSAMTYRLMPSTRKEVPAANTYFHTGRFGD